MNTRRSLVALTCVACAASAGFPAPGWPQSPVAGASILAASPARRETGRLTVFRGEARILRYARAPGTVIIGDEAVAAVSIAGSDILVLTGLAPGTTNVIVLDEAGAQIDRIALSVVDRGSSVIVGRGRDRQVFTCDPICRPADGQTISPAVTGAQPPEPVQAPQGQ